MKLCSVGIALGIWCSLSSAWADELLWTGEAPRDGVKNPEGPNGVGHTKITPDGYLGPGMLGDWFNPENPFDETNPVIEFDHGGPDSDPTTIGQALQFWYRATPDLDHVIVQIRSFDFVGGRYITRIENPSTTWTLFELPFAFMNRQNGITSADHIVFDQDEIGPGQLWVDEVSFVKSEFLVNPALPTARPALVFIALLLAGVATTGALARRAI